MATEKLYEMIKTVVYKPKKFRKKLADCIHPASGWFYTEKHERIEACTACGETDEWKLDPSGGCI